MREGKAMKVHLRDGFSFAMGIAVVGLFATNLTHAGQFKILATETLAPGESIEAHSSPQTRGRTIGIEIFEARSAQTGGKYSCNIVSNHVRGTNLSIRMIGPDGHELSWCVMSSGTGCASQEVNLPGKSGFLCMISTSRKADANAHYIMSVSRH
jgi:hypothetical protein